MDPHRAEQSTDGHHGPHVKVVRTKALREMTRVADKFHDFRISAQSRPL